MPILQAILGGKMIESVQIADDNVHVERLSPRLVRFVVRAGEVHNLLFNKQLVITSGNDGEHASGSAHYRNEAVDLRSHDISATEQLVFLIVLVHLGLDDGIVVFDERANPSKQHWHAELAA